MLDKWQHQTKLAFVLILKRERERERRPPLPPPFAYKLESLPPMTEVLSTKNNVVYKGRMDKLPINVEINDSLKVFPLPALVV